MEQAKKQNSLRGRFSKTSFKERVLEVVRNIPRGETLSYAKVALHAGSPRAARAVGTIMNKNNDKSVPCHRVIKSDGSSGGYNRGLHKKLEILKKEGVNVT